MARAAAQRNVRRNGRNLGTSSSPHRFWEATFSPVEPKEGFNTGIERYLTGKETEPWEIIYFKMHKSELPVLEQALETVTLMLGSDKSRGYCLEMICADFLAGCTIEENQSEVLVVSLERLYQTLTDDGRNQLLNRLREGPWKDCVKNDRGSS